MDEASWNRVGQFYYNGKVISEQPVGQFLWFILFDAIHHSGQLFAYLRPMGGTVPLSMDPRRTASPCNKGLAWFAAALKPALRGVCL